MYQISVAELQEQFRDTNLYPEGTELTVSFELEDTDQHRVVIDDELKPVSNADGTVKLIKTYRYEYSLKVGEVVLAQGKDASVTKAEANREICYDIIPHLLARGLFLLWHQVDPNATKDINKGTDQV